MNTTLPKVVSFTASKKDQTLIKKCADRALGIFGNLSRQDIEMDLTATHANGCPLDLKKLLKAPTSDFIYDVIGIRRHLNRSTGEIENHFSPRCSLPEQKGDS